MDRTIAVVGYARVSTEDQSTEGQILDLQKFGCTEIFRENASGADRDRPQLKAVLGRVRKGDTLVVVRIDRLARSLSHLLSVIEFQFIRDHREYFPVRLMCRVLEASPSGFYD